MAISKRREAIKDWYKRYMEKQVCKRCGASDIRILCWHHVRGKKRREVSTLVTNGYALKTILTEIKKCDCLCLNCHAIIHWEMRNGDT